MDIAEQLKQAPLFKPISLEDLEALVAVMKPQSVAQGTHLFEKGDHGDSMYIVVSGLVRIYSHDERGEEFTLTNYGPGKVFGDFSLLDQQPRSASALAPRTARVKSSGFSGVPPGAHVNWHGNHPSLDGSAALHHYLSEQSHDFWTAAGTGTVRRSTGRDFGVKYR